MPYRVGLFVGCLIDAMRPEIGVATLNILRSTGADVVYKPQSCCGQIAFNSGYIEQTKAIANTYINAYDDCDYIVIPSGSCCATFRHSLTEAFAPLPPPTLKAFQNRCLELSEFLQMVGYTSKTQISKKITFHDSCNGLRKLNIKDAPRQLLRNRGIDIIEMQEAEECCGFGGFFSLKFPDISCDIGMKKCTHIVNSQAQAVVAGDVGCLLHIEGLLLRQKINIECYHWAQLLDESYI